MERYRNLGGNSGVVAYQIGPGFIRVGFKDGLIYRYTDASAGAHNVAIMMRLADHGRGLNSFINRTVRRGYAGKGRN